jgi:hypothetical protein
MRMLDFENKSSVWNLQIYLTPKEAENLRDGLNNLLKDPEANEHFHVMCENSGREISCSIITKKKLSDISRCTKLEQELLMGK